MKWGPKMKRKFGLAVASGIVLLMICMMPASGTPDQMEYSDEEGDLLVLMDPTGYEDDVDIVSVSVDQSSFPVVVVTITVKGNIIGEYEEGKHNWYGFGLDLDGDEDKAEVGVQLTGPDEGKEAYVSINNQTMIEALSVGEYVISGSTFTVNVPVKYCSDHSEVKDFTATATQGFPGTSITDTVNGLFNEDDKPYGYVEPADDDDDDTTPVDDDDDTSPDDDDDDSSTPGFSFALITLSVLFTGIFLSRFRKKL
jgi:hypothetical protein